MQELNQSLTFLEMCLSVRVRKNYEDDCHIPFGVKIMHEDDCHIPFGVKELIEPITDFP